MGLGLVLALASTTVSAAALEPQANRAESSQSLALFELVLPKARSFVFHGCLPLDISGLSLGSDGRTAFAVRLLGSELDPVPAQVEVVTRDARGKPLVIELLAPFTMPKGLAPGRRSEFLVLYGDFPLPTELKLEAHVQAMLKAPGGGPKLIGWDAMGNRFEADLLGLTTHPGLGERSSNRKGYAARGWRTAAVMAPVEGEPKIAPALPHLFGVHAYWTFLAKDNRVSLDLRIHNGLDHGTNPGHELESPLGITYFQALELDLPANWNVTPLVRDPWFGPNREHEQRVRVPIVRRQENGRCHVMPPQGQFLRRLSLHHEAVVISEGHHPLITTLGFCRPAPGLWSWFTRDLRAYFPQCATLPTLRRYQSRSGPAIGPAAIRTDLEAGRDHLRDALTSGKGDGHLVGKCMGWAQPWFYAYAGAAGGADITFVEGHLTAAGASSAGYERLILLHRMNTARHPRALWNRKAEPLGPEAWLDREGRVAVFFRTHARMCPPMHKLPAMGGPAPHDSVRVVHARDLRPDYDQGSPQESGGNLGTGDASIWNWMAHDGEHLIRYTKNPKALVWLGNDHLAKDDLHLTAKLFQLMVHKQPLAPDVWAGGESLGELHARAKAHPGEGLPITRAYAWGVDTLIASYALGTPAKRRSMRPWLAMFAETLTMAGLPNGLVSRRRHETILDGNYDGCQTFEVLFLQNTRRSLIESVFPNTNKGPGPPLRKQFLTIAKTLLSPPVWASTGNGQSSLRGPWGKWALAPLDPETGPPYSDQTRWGRGYLPEGGSGGGIERTYSWDTLAYCMLLAPNRRDPKGKQEDLNREYVLGRALRLGSGAKNRHGIENQLLKRVASASGDHGGNYVAFLAFLEGIRRR